MSCGVGHRCRSDLALLWLLGRPAAVTPIRPLPWEPPRAAGTALKRQKTKKKKKKRSGFSDCGKRMETVMAMRLIHLIHYTFYKITFLKIQINLFSHVPS